MSGSNVQKTLAEPRLIEDSLQNVQERLQRMQNLNHETAAQAQPHTEVIQDKVPVKSA